LDTREKIVPLEQLAGRLGEGRWVAVVGTFDPLILAHAERLAELSKKGKSVLAIVEPGTESLLPAEARATLVAALKSVQLVVISEVTPLYGYPQVEIVTDEEGERERSADFAEHIRQRQQSR
jgi:hypothetical protein